MNNKYKHLAVALSLVSAFFCLFGNTGKFGLLSLLPLFWGGANLLIPNKLRVGPGLTMMYLVLSIRYIVYPVVATMSPTFLKGINASYVTRGIILMLLEILAIILTVKLYHKKKGTKTDNNEKPIENKRMLFPLIGFVILVYCILIMPSVFANRHFIFNPSDIQNEVIHGNGVLGQLERWAEFFVILWLFQVLFRRYQKTQSKTVLFLSFIVISIPCLFFSGHSRLSLLMPLVAALFFLYKCYGAKARTYSIALITGGVFALLSMSLYKMYGDGHVNQALDLFSAGSLDAYFGGLNNVCHGLQAYDRFGSMPVMFVVDTFRNAMGISQHFSSALNTTELFNTIIYGVSDINDQIVPTVVQGLLYFGKFLWWIPTVIMVLVVCVADNKMLSTSDFSIAYLFANFPVVVGWAIPGNYTHLASRFFNYLVPILLLIWIRSIVASAIRRH